MSDDTTDGERIAKVMARAGVASRRDAEKMIVAGRVTVNGQTVTSPALDVTPGDRVTLDGKPIDEPQPARLWLYYKPAGLVTSAKDEKGRQTVFDTMPEGMPRVMSVGRLDLTSEGLLLLTNDGELKRRLELPTTGWLRKYRVRVNGRPNEATFDPLRRGVTIDGEEFLPMDISLDKQQGANAWLTVGLREGKNREIRRAMAEVGLTVNRLIRVSYGPFRLNTMKVGDVVEVRARVLREQLGEGGGEDDAPKPRKPRAGGPKGKPGDRPSKPRAARDESGAPAKARTYTPRPLTEEDGKGKAGRKPGGPRPARAADDAPRARFGAPKPRPAWGEDGAERPARSGGPKGASGDRPYKPRTPREGDDARPPRTGGYKGKTAAASGDRPYKPRTPREGDDARPPRAGGYKGKPAAASGDRPYKPRTPREGDDARPPRTGGYKGKPAAASGERPYKPRAPREGDDARPPRAGGYKGKPAAASGDRPYKPRTPREGDDARPPRTGGYKGKPAGATGDRPYKPRAPREGGTGPRGPKGGKGGPRR